MAVPLRYTIATSTTARACSRGGGGGGAAAAEAREESPMMSLWAPLVLPVGAYTLTLRA
jgi:hypothetical protein